MVTTMVPVAAARPDVLPSEQLLANGMAIPELRPALRHIDNVRNAWTVALGVALRGGPRRRRGLARHVVGLRHRVRPHGPDVRPLRHPHARGGPQAPVHQQEVERLGRHLDHRLSRVHSRFSSTAECTSPTTRTNSVPASPISPSTVRTPARGPTCAAVSGATRSGSPAGRTSLLSSRTSATPGSGASGSPFSGYRRCYGRCHGWPRAVGGSTRCCGGSPG